MTALSTDHLALTTPARTPPARTPGTPPVPELDRLLREGALRTVTGRVVDLRTGRTVPVAGPVLVDLTSPARTAPPAELLRLVDLVRDRGWGVALDAAPGALALLPLVRPDVLTFDLRLLTDGPAPLVAAVVGAVGVQTGRDASVVLVEGLGTKTQLQAALAAGATHGRGPLLTDDVLSRSEPSGPGSTNPGPAGTPVRVPPRLRLAATGTAFDLVTAHHAARPTDADGVRDVVRHLHLRALHTPDPCVVVTTGPLAGTEGDLRQLARSTATVTVVAPGGVPVPVGAHRVDVPGGDPWAAEHVVVVVGPHVSGAVVARPAGAGFEVVVTHDHDLVVDVAARLLTRTPAATTPAPVPVPAPAGTTSPGSGADELRTLLTDALESDRRVGTATGLLLVGVAAPVGTTADPGSPRPAEAGSPAAVVRRLRTGVRSVDRWIPLADDLHAVLLSGLPRTGAEAVVDRVADALLHALESSPLTDPATGARVSIGASLSPTRALTADDAVDQARSALSAARAAGGHCARIRPV